MSDKKEPKNVHVSPVSKKKKKKKNMNARCNHIECNKKISFIDKQMSCKCKLIFCSSHRSITKHKCTANHVQLNKAYLIKNNPAIIPSKLNMV